MLLVNTSMSIEQINNLSFPIISAMITQVAKRICEKNGVPYSNDEVEVEETTDREINIDNQNGIIPLNKNDILDYYSRIGTLQVD